MAAASSSFTPISVPSQCPQAISPTRKLCGLRKPAFASQQIENDLSIPKIKSVSRFNMTIATDASRFLAVPMALPDSILAISEAFKADTSDVKLNLGVGAYRTEDLQPYVLNVVKKAERLMLEKGDNKELSRCTSVIITPCHSWFRGGCLVTNSGLVYVRFQGLGALMDSFLLLQYLPNEGLAAFNKVTVELLLGAGNPALKEGRVATVQSVSGTGSLRLVAAFIQRYLPEAKVLISSPTWENHKNILNDAGVPWSEYRYFDPKTVGLDFDGMIADIKNAPMGSIILLHGCAHNPTGIDPSPEQWDIIADVIQEKCHLAFFDVAYQGFASGSLDDDASTVRRFAARGMELFVSQSYSKNLGLYAERIGATNVVTSSPEVATCIKSQLNRLIRYMYASPPVHGARIVANVVGDPALFDEWRTEMQLMAGRVKQVRQKLYDELSTKDQSGRLACFLSVVFLRLRLTT